MADNFPPVISWNRWKLERFKRTYKEHVPACTRPDELTQIDFSFDGHTFVAAYARYLIEYLDSVLAPIADKKTRRSEIGE